MVATKFPYAKWRFPDVLGLYFKFGLERGVAKLIGVKSSNPCRWHGMLTDFGSMVVWFDPFSILCSVRPSSPAEPFLSRGPTDTNVLSTLIIVYDTNAL